jgi:hypothetical protein
MKTLSKILIAAAAFAAIATTAFSQVPWEFNPGMAYMYAGPGKMSAMAMAATPKKPRCDDEEREESAEQYGVLHG